MKVLSIGFVVVGVAFICGCGGSTPAVTKPAAAVDRAVEVQIGVASPTKPGDPVNSGEFQAVATCVLPVNSSGGPGQSVCNTDGTIVRMRWSDVREIQGGIILDGFNWAIDNWIERTDNTKHKLGDIRQQIPASQRRAFTTEFEDMARCEIDTATPQRTGRNMVIRARLLPTVPPAKPLQLP